MIIEICTTEVGVQLMASPLSRPSRRPRITPQSDLNVYNDIAHQISLDSKPKEGIKRPRRLNDEDHDRFSQKKPRFSIDVGTKQRGQHRKLPGTITNIPAKPDALTPRTTQNPAAASDNSTTTRQQPKYADKAINGIKHELEKLQPSEADTKNEARKLRSQEGTRFKSELSSYFPDYDVVIGNEAAEETQFISIETPIIISDNNPPSHQLSSSTSPKKLRLENGSSHQPYKHFSNSIFDELYQAQKVDFTFLDRHTKATPQSDPLPDSYYDIPHKRGKRLEMSIRNSEKGRAQHEKDQVARLLEGLQGHDWLKVMGVSGITESKKKDYEPARDYFIKGCRTILDKFRSWRDEEKRRKLEKERALAEATHEGDESEESDGDPPDYSDVDHAAAMQLHEEAIARSAPHAPKRKPEKRAKVEFEDVPVPKVEKEFKSFYKKPHLRQAALGKQRKSGRSTSAWGCSIPDFPERDFDLPEDLKAEAATESTARRKRRGRRESLSKG